MQYFMRRFWVLSRSKYEEDDSDDEEVAKRMEVAPARTHHCPQPHWH